MPVRFLIGARLEANTHVVQDNAIEQMMGLAKNIEIGGHDYKIRPRVIYMWKRWLAVDKMSVGVGWINADPASIRRKECRGIFSKCPWVGLFGNSGRKNHVGELIRPASAIVGNVETDDRVVWESLNRDIFYSYGGSLQNLTVVQLPLHHCQLVSSKGSLPSGYARICYYGEKPSNGYGEHGAIFYAPFVLLGWCVVGIGWWCIWNGRLFGIIIFVGGFAISVWFGVHFLVALYLNTLASLRRKCPHSSCCYSGTEIRRRREACTFC